MVIEPVRSGDVPVVSGENPSGVCSNSNSRAESDGGTLIGAAGVV